MPGDGRPCCSALRAIAKHHRLRLAPRVGSLATLPERLAALRLFSGQVLEEGNSRRKDAFRRFKIGTLDDQRDEWLEFWRTNHLLGPFDDLFARRECAMYGGRVLPFMGLADLIRSKETSRDFDWTDVAVLEEFLDTRLYARVRSESETLASSLGQLRSLRGFDSYLQAGLLADESAVRAGIVAATCSITQGFLLPFSSSFEALPATRVAMEPVIEARLRTAEPASSLHLALVEIVRRQYQLA